MHHKKKKHKQKLDKINKSSKILYIYKFQCYIKL